MRLIAGSGRSGTTWVQDALATVNGLRPVFEPLHPFVSDIGNQFAHRTLVPGDEAPELREFLDDVCAGVGIALWTKYRCQLRWLFPPAAEIWSKQNAGRVYRSWARFLKDAPKLAIAARRQDPLVKCIRANLMLGWLSRTCGWKVVLVIRHPGAVIESELRGSWNAEFALERYCKDARLEAITGGRFRSLFARKLQPVEKLAVRWVIENQWVAETSESSGITVTFYEQLRKSPETEWERIRAAFGLSHAPHAEILARPSQQSSPRKSGAHASEVTDPRWRRTLTVDQLAMIQGVLDQAGVTLYSMSDPQPDVLGIRRGRDTDAAATAVS